MASALAIEHQREYNRQQSAALETIGGTMYGWAECDIDREELVAEHYRWWTCGLWFNELMPTLKLGPLTIVAYMLGGPLIVAWTWMCGREHVVIGWRPPVTVRRESPRACHPNHDGAKPVETVPLEEFKRRFDEPPS